MEKLKNTAKIMILLGFVGLISSACAQGGGSFGAIGKVQKLQQVACLDGERPGRG